MLLNCGVGEDSWESLGLQGDPTSPFWKSLHSKPVSKFTQANSMRFQGLRITSVVQDSFFCAYSFTLCIIVLFFWKESKDLQWSSFISLFTTFKFYESDSLLSFCPLSVPFSPCCLCFCWYNSLKSLWVSHLYLEDSSTVQERFFTDNAWIISSLFLASAKMSTRSHEILI